MVRILFTAIVALTLMGSGAVAAPATADEPTLTRNDASAELGPSDASFILAQYSGNRRVCCKRGWRDWWSTYRSCRRNGGHVVANRHCRNDWNEGGNVRVCCKRGWRDWWSTRRDCRRVGGYVVANRQCRRG